MIDILLATYNGEKYLDSQITSIVNQTYKEWTLYIRDDVSFDNTQGVIKNGLYWIVE
jgi:rhamnosyltransferase